MKQIPIIFETKSRAKFSEIDPFGHVNTQHYLAYYLDHRFTGLREVLDLGLVNISKLEVIFVVSNVSINFLRPLYGDEEFKITSFVSQKEDTQCLIEATMTNSRDKEVSTCNIQLTCIDKKTNKVTPWPEAVIGKFYENTKS